jgi:hypothetical protein
VRAKAALKKFAAILFLRFAGLTGLVADDFFKDSIFLERDNITFFLTLTWPSRSY